MDKTINKLNSTTCKAIVFYLRKILNSITLNGNKFFMPGIMHFQNAMSFDSDSRVYRGDAFVAHENASMLAVALRYQFPNLLMI